MRRILSMITACVATLVVLSCEVTPESYPGEPNIHCILCPDSSAARVLVGQTVAIDDTLDPVQVTDTFWYFDTFFVFDYYVVLWEGVEGAKVRLVNNDEEYSTSEDPDTTGYFYTDSISIEPGQDWELVVDYPEVGEITAQTTVPSEFEVTGPEQDTMILDSAVLTWSVSARTAGYAVQGFTWITYELPDTVITDSFLTAPALVAGDSTSFDLDYFDALFGDSVQFIVSALDTNNLHYTWFGYNYWMGLDPQDFLHIDGAWGVFGSKVVARSRVYALPAREE